MRSVGSAAAAAGCNLLLTCWRYHARYALPACFPTQLLPLQAVCNRGRANVQLTGTMPVEASAANIRLVRVGLLAPLLAAVALVFYCSIPPVPLSYKIIY
jgi:hypothetical protein